MSRRLIIAIAGTFLFCTSIYAQTIDDGLMIPKHTLFTGDIYTHDSWSQYWEGTLKRTNGNLGTVTTQTNTWSANYGVTNHLDIIALTPYVWTNASQGVLKGQGGLQDFTLAAKYNLIDAPFTNYGRLRIIGVVSGILPLTNYTPDFQPLSLGLGSKSLSGRGTVFFQAPRGWFINGSAAYTWRSNVKLDRPYYYTNGQLYLSDEVAMPNVFNYVVSGGYLKHGWMFPILFSQQRTLGGGDIRRQDMPFISNRMNYSKLSAMAMFPLPKLHGLMLQVMYGHILDGRNVGYSSTITTGLLYTFHLERHRSKI